MLAILTHNDRACVIDYQVSSVQHRGFSLILQRDFFVGWAKAVALPTEKCGFTSAVGKIERLPTLRWNGIRVHFSL
jgi:hypothetical protein